MGTWGAGSFENDAARDWLAEVFRGEVVVVRRALASAADTHADEYLDADEAQPAVAAAEIVAAARGKGDDRIAGEASLLAWLAHRRDAFTAGDFQLARRAVERVVAKSELESLWGENGPDNEWGSVVKALLQRLGSSGAPITVLDSAESAESPLAPTPEVVTKPAAKKSAQSTAAAKPAKRKPPRKNAARARPLPKPAKKAAMAPGAKQYAKRPAKKKPSKASVAKPRATKKSAGRKPVAKKSRTKKK